MIFDFFRRKKQTVISGPQGKKTYSIPSFDSITIGQYCAYKKFDNAQSKVAALTGMSRKEANRIPVSDLDRLEKICDDVMSKSFERFETVVVVGGTEYRFDPELFKMSGEMFADLMTWVNGDIVENYPKIMAALYRPTTKVLGSKYEVEQYDSDKHVPNAHSMNQVPACVLGGALSFFGTLSSAIEKDIEKSLGSTTLNRMTMEILKTMRSETRGAATT